MGMKKDKIDAVAEAVKHENTRQDVALGSTFIGKSGANDDASTRWDKGRTHVTRYGLLSRDVMRSLVRSGESLRNLRRHEKRFRCFFRPRGTLGELFFDRWWSCYLRLHLIAKLEAKVLTSDHAHRRPFILPELREGTLPTLVSPSGQNEFEFAQNIDTEFSEGLFHKLALAQRYDSHYAREASRMAALLLVMRKGGKAAIENLIGEGLEFTKIQKLGK